MNYLDLFHGIGGFALGAYWAGMKFENHFCSDIEPYCQKLYAKLFPDSIQLGDITKIKAEDLPDGEWIITGGFPCQDISIAGNGEGLNGARSGLWFEYWRLIRDLRPKFAIMENVGALSFRGLDRVLGSLAEIGYDAEWQDIRASDVGAPHKRERIWIVAYPNDTWKWRNQRKGEIKTNAHSDSSSKRCRKEGRLCERQEERTSSGCEISDSNNATTTRQRKYGRKILQISESKRFNRGSCERWWSTEPNVGRVANGIPARVDRLKGLGNSIVPQIAEILFRQIKPLI